MSAAAAALRRIRDRDAVELALAVRCVNDLLNEDPSVTVTEVAQTLAASIEWPGAVQASGWWWRVDAGTKLQLRRLARRALDQLTASGDLVRERGYGWQWVWRRARAVAV